MNASMTTSANVAKAGVSLYLAPGVAVNGASGVRVIDCENLSGTFKVFGGGDIVATNAYAVTCGAGSQLTFQGNRIATSGSGQPAVYASGGTMTVYVANDIDSANYDGVWMDGLFGGSITVVADVIEGGQEALEMTDGALTVRARVLRAGTSITNARAIYAPAGLIDVTCEEATTQDATNNQAINIGTGVTAGSILRIGRCNRQIQLGGGVRLVGTQLDTSSVASLTSLVLQGAATVENVTVTSHSGVTNSISAASTQTLSVNGSLSTNKATSNITLAGPGNAVIAGTPVRVGGVTLGVNWATSLAAALNSTVAAALDDAPNASGGLLTYAGLGSVVQAFDSDLESWKAITRGAGFDAAAAAAVNGPSGVATIGGASSTTSSSTLTPVGGPGLNFAQMTALAANLTINAPSGTPDDGSATKLPSRLLILIIPDATPRTLNWNAIYRSHGATLPTTTTASKSFYALLVWNVTATKWDLVSLTQLP